MGLIHTSWGGTAAELWMPIDAFDDTPQLRDKVHGQIDAARNFDQDAAQFAEAFPAWEKGDGSIDPGNESFEPSWASPDFDASDRTRVAFSSDWTSLQVPNRGVIWIRQTILVLPNLTGQNLQINLYVISGFDTTYFNGEKVGQGGMTSPYFWGGACAYTVPGHLVKVGNNLLAIRVVTQFAKSHPFGFTNRLNGKINSATVSPWVAKVETAFTPPPHDASAAESKSPQTQKERTSSIAMDFPVLLLEQIHGQHQRSVTSS